MKTALFLQHLFVLGSKQVACAGNPDAFVMLQMNALAEPELQTVETAETLDEAGYQAVVSRKSNAEMNSFIRQVIMAHGGKITDKDKFQSIVPNHSGVLRSYHYQRLLKE